MRAGKSPRSAADPQPKAYLVYVIQRRLTEADQRANAKFLIDVRAERAAGELDPQTFALIDRLTKALSRHT